MGYESILWVFEDCVRDAERSPSERERLRPEWGEAVLRMCNWDENRKARRSVGIGRGGNCFNRCDQPHSDHTRAYLWAENYLSRPDQLEDDQPWLNNS